ncbi:MAG: hypothetical protein D4S02_07115 [Rhodocyclaceae bacterium]|nr:MAG: hypothetical protein D4S02_07115 [Rhodocyclaceae bacterium]
MEPPVIAATIAAVTALVAVMAGPFFTFRASKNSMLGPMRQAWINSLRDTVAEFIASIYISPTQLTGAVSNNDDIRHAIEVSKRSQLETTYRLKERICLLINPKEPDHQDLVRLVESAYSAHVEGRDTTVALLAIRKHTQVILKAEWNVVKK